MDDLQKEKLKNYEYDPVERCFLALPDQVDNFILPAGFEDWTVKAWSPDEYFAERIEKQLGITNAENTVELYDDAGALVSNKVFTHNQHGDIEILHYSLGRKTFKYARNAENPGADSKERYAVLTRRAPHRALDGKKYDYAKGKTGNHLFWHPRLLDMYDNEDEVETLVLTEGCFKAWAAVKAGIICCGLPSITIYQDKKDADEIHPEIVDFISRCKVKRVLILWDGDCRNISTKDLWDEEDLYARPGGFSRQAKNVRNLLRKQFNLKRLDIWFGRIKSEDIGGQPKGLDDLLLTMQEDRDRIRQELTKMEGPSYFIRKMDISTEVGMKNIDNDFKLDHVNKFYRFHSEIIGEKEFVFRGNTYELKEGEPHLKIPKNVKAYKRIGTDYYRVQDIPMLADDGRIIGYEQELSPWTLDAIKQDHGKEVVPMIERYRGFINAPSHTNYEPVIRGFWNLYQDISWELAEGDWPHTKTFLQHIFGEQYEMGLDYMKLLYERPRQKVPILCLVSREQETGKSTFVNWVQMIFKSNMSIISSDDLENQFNSQWIVKKIVACEETVLEKRATYERVKDLSTRKKGLRNEKNKTASPIDIFLSFIFCSNDEEGFLKMGSEDKRFWVRKIPILPEYIPDFEDKLESEIEAFLYFLSKREYSTQRSNRMWFDHQMIRTEAFDRVVRNSMSTAEKELRMKLENMFINFNLNEIYLTPIDVKEHLKMNRFEESYLEKIFVNNLKVDRKRTPDGKSKVFRYEIPIYNSVTGTMDYAKGHARAFVFKREDFVTEDIVYEAEPEPEETTTQLPF